MALGVELIVKQTKKDGQFVCRWCDKPLPKRYHLVICPKCRKDSIKGLKEDPDKKYVAEVTIKKRE